eukprot:9417_1
MTRIKSFSMLIAIELLYCAIFGVYSATWDQSIVPSDVNKARYLAMLDHVKALRGDTIDGYDIRKEMEYITSKSLIIYRRMFDEYFGGDTLGFTLAADSDPHTFEPVPPNAHVYVLGSGSFARYEAVGTSDLDLLIIIITPTTWRYEKALTKRTRLASAKRAAQTLMIAAMDYSEKLTAHAQNVQSGRATALALDHAPGAHAYHSVGDFIADKPLLNHEDPELWDIPQASMMFDTIPIHLSGGASYHRLMVSFYEALTKVNIKAMYTNDLTRYYSGQNDGHPVWKNTYANGENFKAKDAILRPLVLPVQDFYELAYRETHAAEYVHRTTRTLERMYKLAEWGFIDLEQVQDVEHAFLWGTKNMLKANVLENEDNHAWEVFHGKSMPVTDANRAHINRELALVERFMDHLIIRYNAHFP